MAYKFLHEDTEMSLEVRIFPYRKGVYKVAETTKRRGHFVPPDTYVAKYTSVEKAVWDAIGFLLWRKEIDKYAARDILQHLLDTFPKIAELGYDDIVGRPQVLLKREFWELYTKEKRRLAREFVRIMVRINTITNEMEHLETLLKRIKIKR